MTNVKTAPTRSMNELLGHSIIALRNHAVAAYSLLLTVTVSVTAQSWHHEIAPHFPPSLPSSASAPVSYLYEFFA